MAVTLDVSVGTKAQAAAATASLVTANTVAAGALIVIGVGYFATGGSGTTVTITTAGGLTWANTTRQNDGSSRSIYLFYAYAPAGLASGTTLTWTTSAGNADWLIGGGSWLGVEATPTKLGENGSNTAAATPWSSGSIVAGEVNLGVVASFEDGSGTATSAPTAITELIDLQSAGQTEAFQLSYDLASASTATLAGAWSVSVTGVSRGAAFKIAAGGPGPVMVGAPAGMFGRELVDKAGW